MGMASSQNGWPASADRAAIGVERFTVHGVDFVGGVKTGDVATVFTYLVEQLSARVERLVDGWCWGHYFRAVVGGGSALSNHSSGTAIDFNAPNHPIGQTGTFSVSQVHTIHAILAKVFHVVRWGGDYTGRKDEMHFEINADAAAVAAAAKHIRAEMTHIAQEEDDMIVATEIKKGKNLFGIYSGGILTGLVAGGAVNAAARNPLWIEPSDWAELDRKSRALIGDKP